MGFSFYTRIVHYFSFELKKDRFKEKYWKQIEQEFQDNLIQFIQHILENSDMQYYISEYYHGGVFDLIKENQSKRKREEKDNSDEENRKEKLIHENKIQRQEKDDEKQEKDNEKQEKDDEKREKDDEKQETDNDEKQDIDDDEKQEKDDEKQEKYCYIVLSDETIESYKGNKTFNTIYIDVELSKYFNYCNDIICECKCFVN